MYLVCNFPLLFWVGGKLYEYGYGSHRQLLPELPPVLEPSLSDCSGPVPPAPAGEIPSRGGLQ